MPNFVYWDRGDPGSPILIDRLVVAETEIKQNGWLWTQVAQSQGSHLDAQENRVGGFYTHSTQALPPEIQLSFFWGRAAASFKSSLGESIVS